MNERTKMCDWFAQMLSYPHLEQSQDGSRFGVGGLSIPGSGFTMYDPPITSHLQEFKKFVEHLTIEEMEELYTRTFDINPVANLEIGWHLYGEQYERGAFLVKMRGLLRTHHIEESAELPDHLTHVLCLLGKMEKAVADEFAAKYLLPALDKILEGFKEQSNPYEHVLRSLKSFIEHQHLAGVPSNE